MGKYCISDVSVDYLMYSSIENVIKEKGSYFIMNMSVQENTTDFNHQTQ